MMVPEWPSSRGAGAGAGNCQGVEAPWHLALTRNGHLKKITRNRRFREVAHTQ